MARHNGEQTKQGGVRIVTTQAAENKVAKFDSMDLGERAFSILVDLGLIDIHPDPESSDYDHSNDDEFV